MSDAAVDVFADAFEEDQIRLAVAAAMAKLAEGVRGLTPHRCQHGKGQSFHLTLWIEDVYRLIGIEEATP